MLSRNIHKLSELKIAGLETEELRRGGRFSMVGTRSDLGKVLDLSHCGALIIKKRFRRTPVLATFPIQICHEDIRVTVMARLARKQHISGIGKVLGLEFLEVTKDQRDKLKEIIQRSRRWNVLPEGQDAA